MTAETTFIWQPLFSERAVRGRSASVRRVGIRGRLSGLEKIGFSESPSQGTRSPRFAVIVLGIPDCQPTN